MHLPRQLHPHPDRRDIAALPAQGVYAGLDQVNVTLPATLKGRGQLIVTVTANGQATNMAQLKFQ